MRRSSRRAARRALLICLVAWAAGTQTATAQPRHGAPERAAERVALLPPRGPADSTLADHVEAALAEALRSLGREVKRARPTTSQGDGTASALAALGRRLGARWVVEPAVRPSAGGYWLTLRVGYAPLARVESIDAEVRLSREPARLAELLDAMLRPRGVGPRAQQLAGADTVGRALETSQ
ncbi:MAG: hypothetical protein KC543_04285, partial [Myxococcales bacterium]|nr:hypothetical protein [Myxococcales bacterium]